MIVLRKKALPLKIVLLFTRQLAVLIQARVPLTRSLELLAKQESNLPLKKIILQVIQSLQEGEGFSKALELHPKAFDQLFIATIKSGELSGDLGSVVQRLADLYKKREEIRHKIKAALFYPCIILSIVFLIAGFLFLIIVPKFEVLLAENFINVPLPQLTQCLMTFSHKFQEQYLSIFVSLSGIALIGGWYKATEQGKKMIDKISLRIPFVGTIFKKNSIASFALTLASLLKNHVELLLALEITRNTFTNSVIKDAITAIHQGLQEGDSIADSIKRNTLFPPMVTGMIEVGEETGELSNMLFEIATAYESDVDRTMTTCIAMLEPLLILVLSLLVGTIVIALFLPLLSMMGELGN